MSTKKELKIAIALIKKYRDTQYQLNKIQLERVKAENELHNFELTHKKPLFSDYIHFYDDKTYNDIILCLIRRFGFSLEETEKKYYQAKFYNDTYYPLLARVQTLIYTENSYAEEELKNIRLRYEYFIDNTTLYEDFGLTYNIVDMIQCVNLF